MADMERPGSTRSPPRPLEMGGARWAPAARLPGYRMGELRLIPVSSPADRYARRVGVAAACQDER